MPRPAGWSVLAERILELGVLAFVSRAMNLGREKPHLRPVETTAPPSAAVAEVAAPPAPEPGSALEFVREQADPQTEYFRAFDGQGEIFAAFLSDGRVRLADDRNRFAGMLNDGQADLLEMNTGEWSVLYMRPTPDGMQKLELRGGPYDARVLTCEPYALGIAPA